MSFGYLSDSVIVILFPFYEPLPYWCLEVVLDHGARVAASLVLVESVMHEVLGVDAVQDQSFHGNLSPERDGVPCEKCHVHFDVTGVFHLDVIDADTITT